MALHCQAQVPACPHRPKKPPPKCPPPRPPLPAPRPKRAWRSIAPRKLEANSTSPARNPLQCLEGSGAAAPKDQSFAMPAAPQSAAGNALAGDFYNPSKLPAAAQKSLAENQNPIVIQVTMTRDAANRGEFQRLLAKNKIALTDDTSGDAAPSGGRGSRRADADRKQAIAGSDDARRAPDANFDGTIVHDGLSTSDQSKQMSEDKEAEQKTERAAADKKTGALRSGGSSDIDVYYVEAPADQITATVNDLKQAAQSFPSVVVGPAQQGQLSLGGDTTKFSFSAGLGAATTRAGSSLADTTVPADSTASGETAQQERHLEPAPNGSSQFSDNLATDRSSAPRQFGAAPSAGGGGFGGAGQLGGQNAPAAAGSLKQSQGSITGGAAPTGRAKRLIVSNQQAATGGEYFKNLNPNALAAEEASEPLAAPSAPPEAPAMLAVQKPAAGSSTAPVTVAPAKPAAPPETTLNFSLGSLSDESRSKSTSASSAIGGLGAPANPERAIFVLRIIDTPTAPAASQSDAKPNGQ